MRKFRYVYMDNDYLTIGKIYEEVGLSVPGIAPSDKMFYIKDNLGRIGGYYYDNWFIDVTAEYRDSVIDNILE